MLGQPLFCHSDKYITNTESVKAVQMEPERLWVTTTNLPSISNNSAIPLCFSVSNINLSTFPHIHTLYNIWITLNEMQEDFRLSIQQWISLVRSAKDEHSKIEKPCSTKLCKRQTDDSIHTMLSTPCPEKTPPPLKKMLLTCTVYNTIQWHLHSVIVQCT